MTSVAKQWNDVFGLLEATQLAALAVEAVNFNFDPAQARFQTGIALNGDLKVFDACPSPKYRMCLK
jgi:hypothetical protein